jgi:ankyrin repeat protein
MASSPHWNTVENLILDRSPRLALQAEDDGLNLLERYAFHGIEHRLLQIIKKLPQDLFSQDRRKGSKFLHLYARQDWELVVLQLRNVCDIDDLQANESSRILAHWASELHWASIPSLLRYKSVPWLNHAAKDGRTALHVTVEHRNKLACEGFLNAGANYLLRGRSHRMPVHTAAEQSHRAILALLLGCPIREYGKDRQGRDLLYFLVI